jgi:hypothetical protein
MIFPMNRTTRETISPPNFPNLAAENERASDKRLFVARRLSRA